MSNRAIRRHHRERLKKRTRKILLGRQFFSIFNPNWNADIDDRVNRRWNNMQMCSCVGCGNPRHAWGKTELTMQEKRSEDREKDDWEELIS